MQRTQFGDMTCSIARTLDLIGEPWSPLILRDRREYTARPPRYEYVLTYKGTDLCDLLLVMRRFGDRWLAGAAGPPVLYRHHTCGEIGTVELHCSHCDTPMNAGNIDVLPG